ncbi:MAG: hypothetical protein FK731_09910 [Asgard group archaeon]|nr:hypothetical protein [Asgard group archaeon]
MPIDFPLSPEKIREEMKRIISEIKEETNWDTKRNLSEITIKIGNAPEYGSIFSIDRNLEKITFGFWLDELTPKYYRTNLVEFLIIRECITFFIDNELLFDSDLVLVQYIINLCALAYLRKKYEKRSFETKLVNIRNRFLFEDEDLSDKERYYHSKIQSLSSIVISQQITYKLLLETFLHFLEELTYTDVDEEEILDYIYRYLSNIPEEIVAPIRLKEKTLQVLEKVVEFGFDATPIKIAKILRKDHATIYREFNKIASRYNAYIRVEKNNKKLGLHFYSILIRMITNNDDNSLRVFNELSKIRYIGEIYEGTGDNFNYIFTITMCPHFVADSFANKLDRLMKNNIIKSFEVKPLINRLYMTTFVEDRFEPSIENYKKLINGQISCKRIKTWDNNNFPEEPPIRFTEKEGNLLKAISVYKSNALANPQSYRVFTAPLKKFALENNVDINKMDDFLSFMNNQRNQLIEKGLIDFRLELTLTDLGISDILTIKVDCNPKEKIALQLIDKMSIFSWIAFYVAHDCFIMQILGLNNEHVITNLITEFIKLQGFECERFTVVNKVWRFVPLAELYHFKGNKWALF